MSEVPLYMTNQLGSDVTDTDNTDNGTLGAGVGGGGAAGGARRYLSPLPTLLFFFTLVTGPRRSLSLKLSDTRIYEPQMRLPPTSDPY